jgi:DNA-binding NarL/FixJ family response regulator
MLNAESDMQVVGTANDGFECVRQAVILKPDIILLDINMPNCNGLEALELLQAQAPSSRVLVLTMHDDAGYLRQVMATGAAGFVLKQAAGKELLAAIRAIHQGGVYLRPMHAQILMNIAQPTPPPLPIAEANTFESRFQLLSDREAEIFKFVALGYRNQEIADQLGLSVKTVETYKSRLMQKLGITSRIALVHFAVQLGILEQKA